MDSCIDLGGPGFQDEATSSLPIPPVARLGCCRVPVPTTGHPVVGAPIPPSRIVLRGLGRSAGRTGIAGDRVTRYRWVQRFTPLLIELAQPCRHRVGRCWFVDETFRTVPGSRRYVYWAVDQEGQVIEVFVSNKRDLRVVTKFISSIAAHRPPARFTTVGTSAWSESPQSSYRRHCTTPPTTPTTASKLTTGAATPGSDQCGVSTWTGLQYRFVRVVRVRTRRCSGATR